MKRGLLDRLHLPSPLVELFSFFTRQGMLVHLAFRFFFVHFRMTAELIRPPTFGRHLPQFGRRDLQHRLLPRSHPYALTLARLVQPSDNERGLRSYV